MQKITTSKNEEDNGTPSPNAYMYNIPPAPKSHGTAQKKAWKDYKSQRTRLYTVRLCILEVTVSYSHDDSTT